MAPRRFDVCVLGSANHDLNFDVARIPAPGETVLARSQSAGPGGKGLNQAVAAARAGATVAFFGSVGGDDAGSLLRGVLADAGVDVTSLRTVAEPTGSAVVLRAEDGENAIVVAAGANGVGFELTEEVRAVLGASAVMLLQQEVPAPVNAAVVEAVVVAQVGAQGVAEPGSARTRIVLNAAPALRLEPKVLDALDVLIVNEHELAAQLPDSMERTELADSALDSANVDSDRDRLVGVARRAATLVSARRSVVVTLGAAGAVCVDASGATHVPAITVDQVVDTTGAGDAFCGAFCAALARGLSLTDAAGHGAAAGGLAARGYGAAPSMATADEIQTAVAAAARPTDLR